MFAQRIFDFCIKFRIVNLIFCIINLSSTNFRDNNHKMKSKSKIRDSPFCREE